MSTKVLDAFLGKGLVFVKVKGLGRIEVDFASIKIPIYLIDVEDDQFRKIEKSYDCIVRIQGDTVNIVPEFLREYSFISTDDDELLIKLEKWFNKNSKKVIANLVGGEE